MPQYPNNVWKKHSYITQFNQLNILCTMLNFQFKVTAICGLIYLAFTCNICIPTPFRASISFLPLKNVFTSEEIHSKCVCPISNHKIFYPPPPQENFVIFCLKNSRFLPLLIMHLSMLSWREGGGRPGIGGAVELS